MKKNLLISQLSEQTYTATATSNNKKKKNLPGLGIMFLNRLASNFN